MMRFSYDEILLEAHDEIQFMDILQETKGHSTSKEVTFTVP
jgi:hypothetical protein